MSEPITDIARAAARAFSDLEGFEATQILEAGAVSMEARVRFRKPDQCTVEFTTYRSPLVELEERLGHGADLVPDDLVGMTLSYDGQATLLTDPRTSTAVLRTSRELAEPLPGFQVIGELGFLETLTHDFLVRDAGPETIEGRPSRLVGLKPKALFRSHMLKTISFPIRRAVVAFDDETRFPTRIQFLPTRDTVLAALLPPDGLVTLTHRDVRTDPPSGEAFSTDAPEGFRTFREERMSLDAPADRLPFAFSLAPLAERSWRPAGSGPRAFLDESGERGYVAAVLTSADGASRSPILTIRAGNFLSRVMARRRARTAEEGRPTEIAGIPCHLLDRKDQSAAGIEGSPPDALDISWTRDDVFWVLSADGIPEGELTEIAAELVSGDAA